jgi:Zn finger protein HypA/HybF involved in hydrogenase expression
MKEEITIPLLKVEDLVSAEERRKRYSLKRDLLALETNGAIASRILANEKNKVKCEKCGKEFNAGMTTTGTLICPDCKQEVKVG